MLKIGYVEENDLLRAGITFCLNDHPEMEVVGSFKSIKELSEQNESDNLDLVIFDTYEDVDFNYLKRMKKDNPKLKMVLLSSDERLFENYVFFHTNHLDALLSKKINLNDLLQVIVTVKNDGGSKIVLPENLTQRILNNLGQDGKIFTSQEFTILKMVGKGKSNKEISNILNLSYRTIETHRRRMIERLGCKNIIPVVLYALENERIQLESNFALK